MVSADELKRLLKDSRFALILDCRESRLRVSAGTASGQNSIAWHPVPWSLEKVLYVGLSHPGRPFGNLTVNHIFHRYRAIEPGSLRRNIADLTKLIKGGDTRGPLLSRVRVGLDVSPTQYGYRFDKRWRFLVVEGGQNGDG